MIVTAADLAAALVFLSLVEGFRRVPPDHAVLSQFGGEWRLGGSPVAVWIRTPGWLWLAPAQTGARTLICPASAIALPGSPASEMAKVREELAAAKAACRSLRPLLVAQALMIFAIVPPSALLASARVAYWTLLLAVALCVATAAVSWRQFGWRSVKYLYPPASLYSASDSTLDCMRRHSFDAVIAALLPDAAVAPALRRFYRRRIFGGAGAGPRDDLVERAAAICGQRKIPLDRILSPPARRSPNEVSFCPSCEAGYLIRDGTCKDCGGAALVLF